MQKIRTILKSFYFMVDFFHKMVYNIIVKKKGKRGFTHEN